MCGILNVLMCVFLCFLCAAVCMCVFCNVRMCVCVCFVMCGCVYLWVL